MQRKTTDTTNANLAEVLFELSAIGNSVKVSAVDPATMTEATIIGPLNAGEAALKRAAVQKLRYVLAKQRPADRRTRDGV